MSWKLYTLLIQRLSLDISNGLREEDVIQRSLEKLPLYKKLGTIKINTTNKEPFRVVNEIISLKRSWCCTSKISHNVFIFNWI